MANIKDFQFFNVSGAVTVTAQKIIAVGTAVLDNDHSVERQVIFDEGVPEIVDPEVILFSALLSDDKKSHVYTRNLSARMGGMDLSNNELVARSIHALMKEFWK
jgi:hypothetical protein